MVGGNVAVQDVIWVLIERLSLEIIFDADGSDGWGGGSGRWQRNWRRCPTLRDSTDSCKEREDGDDSLREHVDDLRGL